MAFKLKSGNQPTFKNMGSSPFKATAAEMRAAGVSEGTVKLAHPDAGEKAYGGDRTWKEGQKASGGTLNDLVAKRKTLEKGSREWNVNQNAINKALGSKKRHDVADKPADSTTKSRKTVTGGTVEKTEAGDTSTKVRTSKSGDRVVTTTKTPDSKSRKVVKGEQDIWTAGLDADLSKSKVKTKTKTGLSTKTKSDDVTTKTKRKGGTFGDTKKKVKTADTVTKTVTGAKGEVKSTKTRKRLGKGLIKDVVAKAKERRATRKANKAAGTKGAPKGTTYDPADDSSNMPT